MLIDVLTNHSVMLARVVHHDEVNHEYQIQYLVKSGELYNYETEISTISSESISGFYYDNDTELSAGFKPVDGGFVSDTSDSDYEPSESDYSEEESMYDTEEDEN
jgi:hypothetical protein